MTRFDDNYSLFLREFSYPRKLRNYETSVSPDAIVFRDKNRLIDFSSNDYLGLAKHPLLINRSYEFAKRWGAGSSSSRLVRGNLNIYEQIETQLANALGKPAALIIGTGFQANASVISALLDTSVLKSEPLIFMDKACHASMYSGISSQKNLLRFHHNDLNHLRQLIEKHHSSSQPKFILAESIYSMEGDSANLKELTEIAQANHATLYIDDAHAVGLYGTNGWGKAADLSHQVDIIMGTFSKALGSFGAYIACSATAKEYLVHRCKGFIYSTALPPAILGSISAAIELVPQLHDSRLRVLKYADEVRQFMSKLGLNYGGSNSHIIPWIIGSAEKTRLAAQLLEQEGILGTAIQAPTVAPNKNRIRFCISALHQPSDFELLFNSLSKISKTLYKF
ncbi:MAG TPA: pyridoxal phosphate-dependent aminotransferase family protein [Gammaproteobacteria bacterium]|nr:pyridoxal phosphate-dependent aminotransferase family protein [Gammaproteobacteria bacterium]